MVKFVYTIALFLVGISPAFSQPKQPQTTGKLQLGDTSFTPNTTGKLIHGNMSYENSGLELEVGSPLSFIGCMSISDVMIVCPQIGKKPPYIKVKRGVNVNKTARLVLTEMCKISHSECVLPRKK